MRAGVNKGGAHGGFPLIFVFWPGVQCGHRSGTLPPFLRQAQYPAMNCGL